MDNDDPNCAQDGDRNRKGWEEDGSDEEKSHTFRKRRLTCSKQQLLSSVQALGDIGDDLESSDEDSPEERKDRVKQPPDSNTEGNDPNEQLTSNAGEDGKLEVATSSKELKPKQLKSRVLHASNPPVPTEPKRKASHLYRHPPHPMSNEYTSSQPSTPTSEWKRSRKQSKDDIGDCTLPFPRDVVGTYSCHGVEPIYDHDSSDEYETSTDTYKSMAKINQDRGGVAFPYANCPQTAVFAAYDGHGYGGELVAQYALHEVPKRLEQHEDFENNVDKALIDVFIGVDEDLGKKEEIDPVLSGCTACVVLMRKDELILANAGDSRAVLAVGNTSDDTAISNTTSAFRALDLTVDQNPDSPGEQERIERMGGFVSPPPQEGLSARVWLDSNYSQIGLAMSRSLGDHAVKPVGVIAEPVISRHRLQPNDEFMIIATDGVWEFLTSQEAVDIVSNDLYGNSQSTDKDTNSTGNASIACQHLIEAAAAKWHEHEGDYRDDITALVVKVKELWRDNKD